MADFQAVIREMKKDKRGFLRQLHQLVGWLVIGSAVMTEFRRCLYSFCLSSLRRLDWGFSEQGGVRVQEGEKKMQGLLRPCLKVVRHYFCCTVLAKANQIARPDSGEEK